MIRIVLIVLEIFIGVNAVGGAVYALTGAKAVSREWLEGSPFKSYVVPRLILLVAVGGSMFAAAGMLLAEASRARTMSLLAGIILVAWIVAQVTIIGRRSRLQDAFAVLGFVVVILSLFLPSPG
ncbi:MAG: hypothetical protein JW990_09755 [Thermoleophilia bacterium]|nr:hypothetical protein [Thermoleophilia bacterium]